MKGNFILSCGSTADLPYAHMQSRDVRVIFYHYILDGVDYEDDMQRDEAASEQFFAALKAGKIPSTSLINTADYMDYFENLLQEGDVLHIAFSSGLSGSCNSALMAADMVREKNPPHKLVVVDGLCASGGYGMLVDLVADLRDGGASIEEAEAWIEQNKYRIHHEFIAGDMTHFRRTGRMSGATALIATVMSICPVMHVKKDGKLDAYSKARGKKNAAAALVNEMIAHAEGGLDYQGPCYVNHSNCPEDMAMIKAAVEEKFPQLVGKIVETRIGTIISCHCGSETSALYYIGDERSM